METISRILLRLLSSCQKMLCNIFKLVITFLLQRIILFASSQIVMKINAV